MAAFIKDLQDELSPPDGQAAPGRASKKANGTSWRVFISGFGKPNHNTLGAVICGSCAYLRAEKFRWYEVSYFESLQRTKPAPFGVNNKDDYHNADLAASVVVGPWQLAFGPVPVDGDQEKSFHDRWMERFAQAAVGKLRPPQQLPLPQ